MARAAIPRRPIAGPPEGNGNPISRVRAGLKHMATSFDKLMTPDQADVPKRNPIQLIHDVFMSEPPKPAGRLKSIGPVKK